MQPIVTERDLQAFSRYANRELELDRSVAMLSPEIEDPHGAIHILRRASLFDLLMETRR